jgi:hypothetical protein
MLCDTSRFFQNRFTGSPSVVEAFAFALNASHLETLSLTTNRTLSDPFLAHFLPRLDAPHLREIHLSAMDLTPRAAPHIVAFLSSPRCRLHTLKCNGNALGHRAVRAIIRAIERCNFGLLRVELYANQLSHGNYAEDEGIVGEAEGGQWAPTGVDLWKECERLLKRVLSRNKHLRRETQKEAVYLLRFTRALLLRPASVNPTADDPLLPRRHPNASCACIRAPTPPSSPASDRTPAPVFSFLCLPTELQLYILSFLAPTLSSAQRIRIYIYASSPGTLPSLLCLPSRGNSACRFGPLGVSGKEMVESGGKRAGVWGAQVGEKARWLVKVGCCVFEPEGEWNGRAECDF